VARVKIDDQFYTWNGRAFEGGFDFVREILNAEVSRFVRKDPGYYPDRYHAAAESTVDGIDGAEWDVQPVSSQADPDPAVVY
jgi:hypothetical protein